MASYVQSASTAPFNATLAYPGNTTAGNLLIAIFSKFNASALPTAITDTGLNTWVLLAQSAGVQSMVSVWAVFGCAGGANTIVATGASGGSDGGTIVAEYAAPVTGSFNYFAMPGGAGQPYSNTGEGVTASLVILAGYDKSTGHSSTGVNTTVRENVNSGDTTCLADADNTTFTRGTNFAVSGGGGNTIAVDVIFFASGGGGGGSTAANPLGGYIG